MNKFCTGLLALCSAMSSLSFAQDMSKAKGIYAGYNLSMMPNRDDLDADQRLDMVSTFRYGGGFEKLSWNSANFGFGFQVGYHTAGQAYKGIDTFTKISFKANTDIQYGKLGGFVYFRSFNRYNPEARFRFNSYLGPYVALMVNFKDTIGVYDANNKLLGSSYSTIGGYRTNTGQTVFDTRQPIYKLYDIGFVVAPGVQYQIGKHLALCLHARADISGGNIENTGNIKKKVTNPPNPQAEFFDAWSNLYAKYNSWPAPPFPAKDAYNVRPSTKNFQAGIYLGVRWYADEQYSK